MNKTILAIFILLFFANIPLAQIPKIDGEYSFSEVVSIDSISKEALYNKAKLFFVDAFRSAKDVIQYDDKTEGKIIGKGFLSVTGNQNRTFGNSWERKLDVYFTMEISCKDNKYRYRIYSISIKASDQFTTRQSPAQIAEKTIEDLINDMDKGAMKKATSEAYPKMLTSFQNTIDQLKQAMLRKSDW